MNASLRIVLMVVALGAAIAAVVIFVVQPLRAKMAADQQAIQDRREQLLKLERVARHITDLQSEIQRLEQALNFFESRLPEEREIDVILREVWLIAEAKQLAARAIRTRKPVESPRYNCQPIALRVEGPFEGFYEWLLGFEQLPRITQIREMQIQRSAEVDGTVQADILVDIFFEK